jgi:hypothetical protein
MRKSSTTRVAALLILSPLLVQAPYAFAAAPPLLSGSYVYTSNKFCQITVTAKYAPLSATNSTPFVKQLSTGAGSNTEGFGAGAIKFVQSAAGKGTATINGFQASGSAILLSSTGGGTSGVDGAPMAAETESGSASFTQTATTVSIKEDGGTSTFHIYYGKVSAGIAQNAVFAGVDAKGCAEQYTLTHS